jgi:hypothetical protein
MRKARGGKDAALEIESSDPAISKALRKGKRYRKVGQIRARAAKRWTRVETVLANGTKETANFAEPGDYIVTGASKERWVVKPDAFEARYKLKPGAKTVYLPSGETVAAENPFGRAVSMMAEWGERQFGAGDCMFACRIDSVRNRRTGKPYIIARAEFDKTYELSPPQPKK